MHQPKAIVFDIGNVLVEWHPERVYAEAIKDPAARAAFFAETGIEAMNLEVDRGARFPDHVHALADRFPHHAAAIRLWAERWDDMFRPEIPGTIALLHRLRAAGVPCHALSNFGRETFERATRTYKFLLDFDIPVISGREGTIKPEARIYEILEERSGLSGPDLFFADDSAKNIAAAAARGWQTFHFTEANGGADGFAAALAALGVAGAAQPSPA